MVNPKLLHDILTLLSRLVTKAYQLIENVTTNIADSWMHVRSKYNGCKVIYRSKNVVSGGKSLHGGRPAAQHGEAVGTTSMTNNDKIIP